MIFTEFRFLFFFLAVFSIHWMLRSGGARKTFLLISSYAFYACWDWRFLSLILASTVVDYFAGAQLGRDRPVGGRRLWIVISVVFNLGLLAFFKYFNFFAASAAELLAWLGFDAPFSTLNIVLPVGISFYTFQTMSYTLDIYRGKLEPTRDPRDFALFVAFFPQLVAGPIVRAIEFLPQLQVRHLWRDVRFRACLSLFLFGFVKKACVSDHLAPIVDSIFADPGGFDVASHWLGVFVFWVQLYCDFSGYSDMAIATAGLLGYRLPENFLFPYFSFNLTDFWRRWHITLSTWVRDYLFFSMGGSRGSPLKVYSTLIFSFMVLGLWHGAAWSFVIFGAIHGVFLSVERMWGRAFPDEESLVRRVPHFFGPILMNACHIFAMVFFRAGALGVALGYVGTMLSGGGGDRHLDGRWWWVIAGFMLVHFAMYKRVLHERMRRLPDDLFTIVLGIGYGLALVAAARDVVPFVYFQF